MKMRGIQCIIFGFLHLTKVGLCDHVLEERAMKISSTLGRTFDADKNATPNVIVTYNRQPQEVFNTMTLSQFESQAEFNKVAIAEMEILMQETQAETWAFLEGLETPVNFKSFWITNQLFVEGATMELCEALGSFEEVERIDKEDISHIDMHTHEGPIIERGDGEQINAGEPTWNIQKVRAPEVWSTANGTGCTVGIIDTGCRGTHEAFAPGKFIAFKDCVNGKSQTVYDDNGHGTHVAGTICGKNGIGVAPGASIVAGKACDSTGACTQSAILDCGQFVATQNANVISNSWGGAGGNSAYQSMVDNWVHLGAIPIFSCGNSGPSCGTMGSPADYVNVCSVGATTSTDSLADFSSRGACKSGEVGPKLCAPGHKIMSSWHTSDTAYNTISGTSMAAPHVSGLAAVLVSKNPSHSLSFDKAVAILTSSSKSDGLVDPNQTCGSTSISQKPNNMYGYGRIDCANAIQQVLDEQSNEEENAARARSSKTPPPFYRPYDRIQSSM